MASGNGSARRPSARQVSACKVVPSRHAFQALIAIPTNASRPIASNTGHADYLTENACRGARLEPTSPEMSRLVAALQGNQVDTDRFVGAFVGTVAREEFFAPENLQRILGRVNRSAVDAE